MEARKGPAESPCRKCCSCLVPVRCIIDQHEVEIIPASARSCTSNDYSVRGGSSFDSTSRTAYGSGSYRQYQHQQLSERAARVDMGRGGDLFNPSNQGPASVRGGAAELASYRSAGASDLFNGGSRQSSWDTKAPRVPLINLRKIQHHGATLPVSPADEARAAAWQSPKLHKVTCSHMAEPQDGDRLLLPQVATSEAFSAPPQECEYLPPEFTTFSLAQEIRGQQGTGAISSHSSNEGWGGEGEERASVVDIQCLRKAAIKSQLRFNPGYLLSSHLEGENQQHDGSVQGSTKSSEARECVEYDVYHAADGFSSFGMDISYDQVDSWMSRSPRTVHAASTTQNTKACAVQLHVLKGEPLNAESGLKRKTTQTLRDATRREVLSERQKPLDSSTHFVEQDLPIGPTNTTPSSLSISVDSSNAFAEKSIFKEKGEGRSVTSGKRWKYAKGRHMEEGDV
ncbi:hypothetical protein Emed_006663 [Eimeria media]